MKIEVDYLRGAPNMRVLNAETGEEVAIVLVKSGLSSDEKVIVLDEIARLLGSEFPSTARMPGTEGPSHGIPPRSDRRRSGR